MHTTSASAKTLPFDLGEPRSFRGLTLIPLFAIESPELEYIGLDEAVARGLTITELGTEGVVELLAVDNPLADCVLLYEGEELVGAKQNRIVEHSILVAAESTVKIPAKCVERGRWSHSTAIFAPAPRAAYPSLRRAQRAGQGAVWAEVSAKAMRLDPRSPTEAAEAMYVSRGTSLDEYAQAFPRLDGQSGALVGIGGRLACLDYVSRSDVFAGLYSKLLRGYALDAIEAPREAVLSQAAVGRFLGELELAERREGELAGYVVGRELAVDGKVVALTAFPAR